MLDSKSFLAVDFGAGSLKLAEFEVNEAGGLRLKQYGIRSLGAEGAQEAAREGTILKALQETLAQKAAKASNVNVCAPGFHVFSKFVKLPPVDAGKVTQIIQYEAQQNVPFPLEEVVWDYQILGSTPAALCNAFRYNYGDLEDCTMLLDIGAKTSNLLFFEKGKVFSRSINLGANSITQDFANESKLKFDPAEKIKIEEGFVSLGGAYEEPENPHQAAISKIARQFMTRLHIQVNQTMQFYRGQQGGSAPQRLFLSGGASIMPYTAQFFAEKLNVPVEFFNPLRNVQIDPAINLEELARCAHSLGEVVGLGLRNLAHCPVELNLMPESTLRWQAFNQKKPYFIATVFSLVLVIAAMAFLFDKLAAVKSAELKKTHDEVVPQQVKAEQFKRAFGELKKTQQDVDQVVEWINDRYYWADVLGELRRVLIRAEDAMKTKLHTDAGVWIELFTTAAPAPEGEVTAESAPAAAPVGGVSTAEQEAFRRRYGLAMPGAAARAETPQTAETGLGGPKRSKGATNEISTIAVTFRAVSLNAVSPGANLATAYAVVSELQSSPMFDPAETVPVGGISDDEPPGTFKFAVDIKLKRPLKL